MRVELPDSLAQGGVCCGDGSPAAVRCLLRARQDRAVEGEIFARHCFRQHAGIVFGQMKPEIVLPHIDILTAYQKRCADHSRWLPNDEF